MTSGLKPSDSQSSPRAASQIVITPMASSPTTASTEMTAATTSIGISHGWRIPFIPVTPWTLAPLTRFGASGRAGGPGCGPGEAGGPHCGGVDGGTLMAAPSCDDAPTVPPRAG